MTDVRRSGPPRRLEDQTRFGIPIEGEVDGIWQRAFHVHLAEEVRWQPDLPGGDFFEKSLTINPEEIKFRFVASVSVLPDYLNLIESVIPQANRTAAEERRSLDAAFAEAEREVHERDQDIERELRLGRQATCGELSRGPPGDRACNVPGQERERRDGADLMLQFEHTSALGLRSGGVRWFRQRVGVVLAYRGDRFGH